MKAKTQTFRVRAMSGANAAKMSKVTAATTLRLPRSAATATGSPQPIWATAAAKVRAPRPASLRWNDLSMSGPSSPIPLLKVPVTREASVNRPRGATPCLRSTPVIDGGFPSPVPGTSSMPATASRSRCWLTASLRSSSGTVNSNKAWSAIVATR